jgi:hypothetical protein
MLLLSRVLLHSKSSHSAQLYCKQSVFFPKPSAEVTMLYSSQSCPWLSQGCSFTCMQYFYGTMPFWNQNAVLCCAGCAV